jgi:hypothetical protein
LNRVEKYRPSQLDEIISHQDIIGTSGWRAKRVVVFGTAQLNHLSPFSSYPLHRREPAPALALLWTSWNRQNDQYLGNGAENLWTSVEVDGP